MSERDVKAELIGRRYDCDECGQEMTRDPSVGMLTVNPPRYVHVCANGHRANLTRSYPGYDVFITQEPADAPEGHGDADCRCGHDWWRHRDASLAPECLDCACVAWSPGGDADEAGEGA